MKKILVAFDGSEHANKALEKAKEIGRINNSEIIIMHVMSTIRNIYPHVMNFNLEPEVDKALLELGKELLEEAENKFKDYPGKVSTFLVSGDPGNEIINKSNKENCDLVIMGSRGLNAFSRVMIGSVSNKVLNHIDASILVVK